MLIYRPDVTKEVLDEVLCHLSQGMKVYLFTADPEIEELNDKHLLFEKAARGELLRTFLVAYDDRYADQALTVVDGNITDKEREWLDYFSCASAFNREQYVLEHMPLDRHLIVKAGAGTGKTTVMLDRVLYLKHLQPELPLKNIVMLTFTTEAAQQMKSRILNRLAAYYECTRMQRYLAWIEEAGEWFIGTIHAFAHRILKEEGASLGFLPSLKIRSYKFEKQRLTEKWLDHFASAHPERFAPFKLVPQYVIVSAVYSLMEKMEQKSVHEQEMGDADYGVDEMGAHHLLREVLTCVQQELSATKRARQEIEIHDLIRQLKPLTKPLTEHSPAEIGPIDYLMVDEFQDTDEVQVHFLVWLIQRYGARLFAVGDVKQSIYRFRGADYTAFSQLSERLEQLGERYLQVSLVKNYRSQKRLLRQLDMLFRKWPHWVNRFSYSDDDRLISAREEETDEAAGLFLPRMDDSELKVLLKRLEGEDVAILVRTNQQVDEMARHCERLGFFCEAKRRGTFFRSLPVREFYLLVRRFTHPLVWRDRYLFHLSSYGERRVTVSQLLRHYRPDRPYVAELLNPYDPFSDVEAKFREQSALQVLEELAWKMGPDRAFALRLYDRLKRENSEWDDAVLRREVLLRQQEYAMNLEHLFYLLKKEFGKYPVSLFELEQYLAIKMASDAEETEIQVQEPDSHRFKVMTVHQAKGLEFDYVILPKTDTHFFHHHGARVLVQRTENGWQVGYQFQWQRFRLANSHMKAKEVEEKKEMAGEEARLLYVALTRAKKAVYAAGTMDKPRPGAITSWRRLLVREEG